MRKQRSSGALSVPAGGERLFPDKDSVDQFMLEWTRIQQVQPEVKLRDVFGILLGARIHCALDRVAQDRPSRYDFLDRVQRIRRLLVELYTEIAWLLNRKNLGPVAEVRAFLARPVVKRPLRNGGVQIMYGEVTFNRDQRPSGKVRPGASTVNFEPLKRACTGLLEALSSVLDPLEDHLRRPRGFQPRPWVAEAMRDLRNIGLKRHDADVLLRIVGLKGSEAAEATRQTVSRR